MRLGRSRPLDPIRLLSAANALEVAMVIESRLGSEGGREFDLFLHRAEIDIAPVTSSRSPARPSYDLARADTQRH